MSPRESTSKRPRRDKYISRACQACQRRKSKCSGHDPCLSCQARDLTCTYNTEKRRPRKPTSRGQRVSRKVTTDGRGDSPSPETGYLAASANLETGNLREKEPLYQPPVHENQSPGSLARSSLYSCVGEDPNPVSLRSQVSKVRALFNSRDDSALEKGKDLYGCRVAYDIELPVFSKIQESLHIYFENVGRHYPAIQREDTRSRIHETIGGLTYISCGGGIHIDYVAAPTVALLCIIIAIAEMTENNTLSFDTRATHFANHARSLLQTFGDRPANLEVLRCHTLITIYLLHMECLDLALQSIAVTVRLAMALQLHRRSSSPKEGGDSYDQYLWWTIYVLDRDLACLGGIPYLIRDEEIDAPRPARDGQFKRFSRVTYINCSNEVIEQSGWMKESVHQEAVYLETLAYLGRLWARIWEDLATDISELDCQWQATETLDAQLRVLRQQLPAELAWMSPSDLSIDVERSHETAMEKQLIILMRINTLRLFIRRNPASKCTCLDRKSPHDDGTAISAQTIKAIVDFSTHHQGLSPIGHFISTTLVQCILYLIKTIGESSNTSETESASASVVSAYQALVDLSKNCISARSAVKTLDEALFRHDGAARPKTATIPQPYLGNSRYPGELEEGRAQRPRRRRKKSDTPASPEESHRGNDLFGCLQKSYESLDGLLPNTMPTL